MMIADNCGALVEKNTRPAAPPVDPKESAVCGKEYSVLRHGPTCQLPPNHEPEPCEPRRTT
jgi:hypothetical protein